jgi:hypothetical protein
VQDIPASNTLYCAWDTSVSPFQLNQVFFKEWIFLHFKTLFVCKHSFHMLTQFSQGDIVLQPPASNLHSFLQEIECFFHSLEKGYFAQRLCSSHFKTLRDRQYSFSKLTHFKLLNKVLDLLSSNICGSPTRHIVFLPFIERGYFTRKWSCSHSKTLRDRWNSF